VSVENLTIREIDIILHASGLSQGTKQYRTHYCANSKHPQLCKLVADGYFTGPHPSALIEGDSAMFFLTEQGIEAAKHLASRFNSFRCDCPEKDEEE